MYEITEISAWFKRYPDLALPLLLAVVTGFLAVMTFNAGHFAVAAFFGTLSFLGAGFALGHAAVSAARIHFRR